MSTKVIGIDLGATNVRGAVVTGDTLSAIISARIHSDGSVDEVLNDIYQVVDQLIKDDITAIGIGVPSVVDVEQGIVYDVLYIPSWVEVPLKKHMEDRYHIPVFVNNDANCFAVGEHYFGKGKGVDSMIGMTLGTGLGAGVIVNNKLYAGYNCGAGEFGLFNYKDNILEYYASGSFFQNVYGLDGTKVFEEAKYGGKRALELYAELGTHIGNAVKMAMYAYDPQLIILGGSVRHAWEFFEKTMWEEIRTCVFTKSAERIRVESSGLQNSGILGAAALYYDAQ
ncbi:ROK family protein [Mucilaginibacter sp.]|jgi:glucokinase|uniref:ROK family protein n=1 Tax=Mucilaginibacter sp. TaxID=1882438 RepID=UPI002C533C9C|nr:ROK family protein [Mucilaginibacter sp.]HTI60431.1 ROK family protein [Mucilaginibacter sp.]